MAVNVAINGFGRIGRLVLRGIIESGRKDVNVVAINDLGSVDANAHMLQYDSVHGNCRPKCAPPKPALMSAAIDKSNCRARSGRPAVGKNGR